MLFTTISSGNTQHPLRERLELRSQSGREALVLEPTNFFYFDEVTPQGILHMRLINDEDQWDDCC